MIKLKPAKQYLKAKSCRKANAQQVQVAKSSKTVELETAKLEAANKL